MQPSNHRDRRPLYPWVGVLAGLVLVVAAAWAADFIPGDVNDDGVFDIADPTVLRRELAGLGPGISQLCGNGLLDPNEDCDLGELAGQTCVDVGLSFGTLSCGAGCTFDTSGCTNTRFIDNGDGTISDDQTGLMWEKKTTDSSIHDENNVYTWSARTLSAVPDGTAFTTFLGTLNNGTSTSQSPMNVFGCFAGHCDWRLPTFPELQTILLEPSPCGNIGFPNVCIDPIFGPTERDRYYSATSLANNQVLVWVVDFSDGFVEFQGKANFDAVRAVRDGP